MLYNDGRRHWVYTKRCYYDQLDQTETCGTQGIRTLYKNTET
jgi:hypothetical protein